VKFAKTSGSAKFGNAAAAEKLDRCPLQAWNTRRRFKTWFEDVWYAQRVRFRLVFDKQRCFGKDNLEVVSEITTYECSSSKHTEGSRKLDPWRSMSTTDSATVKWHWSPIFL
jgi:hypothetical protein